MFVYLLVQLLLYFSDMCNLECKHGGIRKKDTCKCDCPIYRDGQRCGMCQNKHYLLVFKILQ